MIPDWTFHEKIDDWITKYICRRKYLAIGFISVVGEMKMCLLEKICGNGVGPCISLGGCWFACTCCEYQHSSDGLRLVCQGWEVCGFSCFRLFPLRINWTSRCIDWVLIICFKLIPGLWLYQLQWAWVAPGEFLQAIEPSGSRPETSQSAEVATASNPEEAWRSVVG